MKFILSQLLLLTLYFKFSQSRRNILKGDDDNCTILSLTTSVNTEKEKSFFFDNTSNKYDLLITATTATTATTDHKGHNVKKI
jgi:hypothetical protein